MKTLPTAFVIFAFGMCYIELLVIQRKIDYAIASIPASIDQAFEKHKQVESKPKQEPIIDIEWYKDGEFYHWVGVSEAGRNYCKQMIARPDGHVLMWEETHRDMLKKCPLFVVHQ